MSSPYQGNDFDRHQMSVRAVDRVNPGISRDHAMRLFMRWSFKGQHRCLLKLPSGASFFALPSSGTPLPADEPLHALDLRPHGTFGLSSTLSIAIVLGFPAAVGAAAPRLIL
jgi:hypothetical protein